MPSLTQQKTSTKTYCKQNIIFIRNKPPEARGEAHNLIFIIRTKTCENQKRSS
jgi:hypothetical protein